MGGKQILRCLLEKRCLMSLRCATTTDIKLIHNPIINLAYLKKSSRKWPLLVKKCVYLHKTNRTTPKSSCRYTNGGTNNGQETSKTM